MKDKNSMNKNSNKKEIKKEEEKQFLTECMAAVMLIQGKPAEEVVSIVGLSRAQVEKVRESIKLVSFALQRTEELMNGVAELKYEEECGWWGQEE